MYVLIQTRGRICSSLRRCMHMFVSIFIHICCDAVWLQSTAHQRMFPPHLSPHSVLAGSPGELCHLELPCRTTARGTASSLIYSSHLLLQALHLAVLLSLFGKPCFDCSVLSFPRFRREKFNTCLFLAGKDAESMLRDVFWAQGPGGLDGA